MTDPQSADSAHNSLDASADGLPGRVTEGSRAREDELTPGELVQTLADSDQTLSGTDQTNADADQASADCDQAAADRDQAASDRDLARGANLTEHEITRAMRQHSARQRERAAQSRLTAAADRDRTADTRDAVALARDRAADLRLRDCVQTDVEPDADLPRRISDAFSRLYLDMFGRGPLRAETFIDEDVITVVLHDVLNLVERALVADDRADNVVAVRALWQQASTPAFKAAMERLTGRRVLSIVGGLEVNEDVATQVVILAARQPSQL